MVVIWATLIPGRMVVVVTKFLAGEGFNGLVVEAVPKIVGLVGDG